MPYLDPLKQKENHRKWHFENQEKILTKQKRYRLQRKLKVLEKYSQGKIACSCCGESTIEFLSIDHINGGGTSHRIRNRRVWFNGRTIDFQSIGQGSIPCTRSISIAGRQGGKTSSTLVSRSQ